jgi:hypothetical protein
MNNKVKTRILIQIVIVFAAGFALMYAILFLINPPSIPYDRYRVLFDHIVCSGVGGLVCGITILFTLNKYVIPKGQKGGKVLMGWILNLIVGFTVSEFLDEMFAGLRISYIHFLFSVTFIFGMFLIGYMGGSSTVYFMSETMPDNCEMKLWPLIALWSFGSGFAGLLALILQNITTEIFFDLVQFTINGAIIGSLMGLVSGLVILRYYRNLTKAVASL